MKKILLLAFLIFLSSCSGCDDDKEDKNSIERKWSYDLYPPNSPDLHDSRSATLPLVLGDNVYFTYRKDYEPYRFLVGGFDLYSGDILWNYESDRQIEASRFKTDGTSIYLNLDDSVICLNSATGNLIWGTNVGFYGGWGEVTLGPDFVLFGHGYYDQSYSKLFKLNKLTGRIIWEKTITANNRCVISSTTYEENTGLSYVSLHIDADTLLGNQSEIICLQDSNILWQRKFNFQNISGPTSVFMFSDNRLIFATGSDVWALNKSNGDSIWKFTDGEGLFDAPILVNDKIYSSNINGGIYCLNATSGSQAWKATLFGSLSRALSNDSRAIYACDGLLWGLDLNSGKIIVKAGPPGHNTDINNVFSGPVGVGENRIFVVGTRAIYCYSSLGKTSD